MGDKVMASVLLGSYADIFWRKHTLAKKGDFHQGHKHIIDHATLVLSGSVEVQIDNEVIGVYKSGDIIEIDKDKWHKLTALEDNTIYFCIFATNNKYLTYQKDNPNLPLGSDSLEQIKKALCSSCTGCD